MVAEQAVDVTGMGLNAFIPPPSLSLQQRGWIGQTLLEECCWGAERYGIKPRSRGVRALEGLRAPTQHRAARGATRTPRARGAQEGLWGSARNPLGPRQPGRARPRWAAVATWRRAPSTDPRRDGPPPGRLPPRPLSADSQARRTSRDVPGSERGFLGPALAFQPHHRRPHPSTPACLRYKLQPPEPFAAPCPPSRMRKVSPPPLLPAARRAPAGGGVSASGAPRSGPCGWRPSLVPPPYCLCAAGGRAVSGRPRQVPAGPGSSGASPGALRRAERMGRRGIGAAVTPRAPRPAPGAVWAEGLGSPLRRAGPRGGGSAGRR